MDNVATSTCLLASRTANLAPFFESNKSFCVSKPCVPSIVGGATLNMVGGWGSMGRGRRETDFLLTCRTMSLAVAHLSNMILSHDLLHVVKLGLLNKKVKAMCT